MTKSASMSFESMNSWCANKHTEVVAADGNVGDVLWACAAASASRRVHLPRSRGTFHRWTEPGRPQAWQAGILIGREPPEHTAPLARHKSK